MQTASETRHAPLKALRFREARLRPRGRARQYDPETGTFLSQDPIGYASGDPNYYRYVFNNPLLYTDPYGLATFFGVPTWVQSGVAGVIAGGTAGLLLGGTGGTVVLPVIGTVAAGTGGAIIGGVAGGVAGALGWYSGPTAQNAVDTASGTVIGAAAGGAVGFQAGAVGGAVAGGAAGAAAGASYCSGVNPVSAAQQILNTAAPNPNH